MRTSDSTYRSSGDSDSLAASFPDRGSANKALRELHDAGFRKVWLGVTRGDTTTAGGATVESEGAAEGGMMGSVGRFFSGEGAQSQALHQALIAHGLSDEQARRLEMTVPADSAIVVVDGENDPDEALDILQANAGRVDSSALGSVGSAAALGAPKANRSDVDDARRVQLREERLSIDKQRVASGEARIRKEVVSEQQLVDVPVYHEELFIQRRPVSGAAATTTTPIGEGEEIRIPLSEERVDVRKQTVVTEEVAIGKRKVEETEHVSDTVRHEELVVDEGTTGATPRAKPSDPRGR